MNGQIVDRNWSVEEDAAFLFRADTRRYSDVLQILSAISEVLEI